MKKTIKFLKKNLIVATLGLLLIACNFEDKNKNFSKTGDSETMNFIYTTEKELNEVLNENFKKGDDIVLVNERLEKAGFMIKKDWKKDKTVSYVYTKSRSTAVGTSKTEIRAWFTNDKLDKIVGILLLTGV